MGELLMATPGIRQVKVTRICRATNISQIRRVRDLTHQERCCLVEKVPA